MIEETDIYKLWLNQFEEIDRPYAQLFIKNLHWVSSHEFSTKINDEINNIYKGSPNEKIALFVEREVSKNETVYSFQQHRPRRSTGIAFPPISPNVNKAKDYEIGSEGILNNIATAFQRAEPYNFFYYPDAEIIREKKIKKIIILTDTIASGGQLRKFLDSFSRTPSIKSWHSSGYISFHVVCYAITEKAISYIQNHVFKPKINFVCVCPTIDTTFNAVELKKINALCIKYNPCPRKKFPFEVGYGDIGSLIYYEHGIPNNAPEMLHKRSSSWEPLFKGRTTKDVSHVLPSGLKKLVINDYAALMREKESGLSEKFNALSEKGRTFVIVLLALRTSPRSELAISKKSKLPYNMVLDILVNLRYLDWIDERNRLTDEGYLLLKYLTKKENFTSKTSLSNSQENDYYPYSLRRP